MRTADMLVVALVLLGPTSAGATDQTVLGKSFAVKDPMPGVEPARRGIDVVGKEPTSDDTIVGDPMTNGATVEIFANGATSGSATFTLPPGVLATSPAGWKPGGTPVHSYTYKDTSGLNGPVKNATIKKSATGTFVVKASVKGSVGLITLLPPAPGTEGAMRFTINGGDTYCVRFGGPAGGVVTNAPKTGVPNKTFKIVSKADGPTTEAGCPTPPTTTSTSTSTSTTSTLPSCVATSGPYCDLGDGRVLDQETGLQWEKKTTAVGSGSNPSDLHDVDNTHTWAGCCDGDCETSYCQPNAAAQSACRAQTPSGLWASGGCNQCAVGTCEVESGAVTTVWDWVSQLNAANFAGHGDWRLPSENGNAGCNDCEPAVCERELEKLFDDTVPVCDMGGACIDPIFGPTTSFDPYWSSTTRVGFPEEAIAVYFLDGGDEECGPDLKEVDYYVVRAVRGTP